MMKILVCPDKFKGSLTSLQVIDAVTLGARSFSNEVSIVGQPLADGGEGSLQLLADTLPFDQVTLSVYDPLFRPVQSYYLKNGKDAYIEMALVSGLQLLTEEERDPLLTSTYGTGQIIFNAIEQGCTHINMFVGGSATNDCGIGLAHALGFQFFDREEKILKGTGKDLVEIARIDDSKVDKNLASIQFSVYTDVQNPLLGPSGAAHVYAAQKGADEERIKILESGAKQLVKYFDSELANRPGAGAAGGLGFGATAFLNAELRSGIDLMLRLTKMEEKVQGADLVITGEGSVDEQSLQGKVIDGLKRMCEEYNKPLFIVCGRSTIKNWDGIPIYEVMDKATDINDAILNTSSYIKSITQELLRDFKA